MQNMFEDNRPLAERQRPKKLTDLVGQEHLVAEKGVIRLAIKQNKIPSMILWGPPGVGKSCLLNRFTKDVYR